MRYMNTGMKGSMNVGPDDSMNAGMNNSINAGFDDSMNVSRNSSGNSSGNASRNASIAVKQNELDTLLLVTTLSLVLIGIFMVYSSTSVVAPSSRPVPMMGESHAAVHLIDLRYLKKHLISVFLGLVLMMITYRTSLDWLRKYAIPVGIFSVLLLLAVKIPHIGLTVNGARRWIRIGFFTFQPSESMKLAMVLCMSMYLSGQKFRPDEFTSFLKPVVFMVMVQGILLLQPDFGSASIIGAITFALLFINGVRLKYIFSVGLVMVPIIIKLVMEPYRLKRILVFLHPWADERNSGFQLIQSFVALGNGGLNGVGLGKSTQKLFFLPESKTDFIFAIIGEETGFLGALFVILLFILFFVRGVAITRKFKDGFFFNLSCGITLLIAMQAVINMAVVTGLVPTKGLPLPFISYGGSSMIVNLAEVGLLLNLAKRFEPCRQEEPAGVVFDDTVSNDEPLAASHRAYARRKLKVYDDGKREI
ncbi:MAG: putative lipid II flippase FtsW [Nitrospirae bacterium]|nr:putative lipid II flippase FtsW [Nitrospirota bacterium]